MKIKALDTYFLSAPLPQPVRTSTSTISRVSELIVKLTTDSGLVGIGEAHGPFLSQGGPEAMKAVGQIIERVTPLVVGQDPFSVERVWQDLFSLTYTSVRGIPTLAHQRRQLVTAISAIDIAMWDLMGKATGRPVALPMRSHIAMSMALMAVTSWRRWWASVGMPRTLV